MNDEMRAVYIRAMVVSAEARISAMQAANIQARMDGDKLPYGFNEFEAVPAEFGITHNQVIGYLTGR